jgi:hypothetical protein
MTLKDLVIQEDDFDVFIALNPAEKIEFLWDAMRLGIEESVEKQLAKFDTESEGKLIMSVQDIHIGPYRLTIMNIEQLIVLNSDNLKVLRNFTRQMWNNGYVLVRRRDIRKSPNAGMMKYFMAYEIVGQVQPISEN